MASYEVYNPRYEHACAERRRALARPWPWRIWAYACWLSDVLPAGPGMVVAMVAILGTAALIVGLVFGLIWLWETGATWIVYLSIGWGAHLGLSALWRGTHTLVRAILATDRAYRSGDQGAE